MPVQDSAKPKVNQVKQNHLWLGPETIQGPSKLKSSFSKFKYAFSYIPKTFSHFSLKKRVYLYFTQECSNNSFVSFIVQIWKELHDFAQPWKGLWPTASASATVTHG